MIRIWLKPTRIQARKPKFGSRPNYGSPGFDFQKELDRLPFPLNLGNVEMSKEQQVRFLELIYDNQSVFSLCDEGFRSLRPPQAHNTNYYGQTSLSATSHHSSSASS